MERRESVVIAEVEEFIRRWTNGELTFTPETRKMQITVEDGTNFLGRLKIRKVNLPNEIGSGVAHYQLIRDLGNPDERLTSAYELLDMIQRARVFGLIKDSQQQTRAYEQEIEQLNKQISDLMELNKKLTLENKTLHQLIDRNKGGPQVGEFGR